MSRKLERVLWTFLRTGGQPMNRTQGHPMNPPDFKALTTARQAVYDLAEKHATEVSMPFDYGRHGPESKWNRRMEALHTVLGMIDEELKHAPRINHTLPRAVPVSREEEDRLRRSRAYPPHLLRRFLHRKSGQ